MANILIVDDDLDIVEAMKIVLEKHGHRVKTASDGREGLTAICTEKPDLIVLDVMMPPPDGFEVAREVKRDSQIKHIPILMLTAIKDKTGLDFQKEVGDPDWLPVDDYCNKPLDYEILLEKIRRLLPHKTAS